MPYLSSRP